MRSVCGCTPASSAATEMTYRPFLVPSVISHSQMASRRCLGGLGQRLHGLALVSRELGRHRNLGRDEEVTGALADGHAAALDPERASRTRAGGDAQRDRTAVERRHLDLGAEDGLWERDRHGEHQILALAVEQLVGRHMDNHVEVARRTSVPSGPTAALQADALAVADPGGDPHLDLTRTAFDTASLARRARRLDDRPPPVAVRAGPAERERPLVVLDRAAAATRGTHAPGRARRRA